MKYGQFCPIAKASEIIGEKWTILIIRELLMGARRFSDLERGLGQISPSVLTKRLALLDARGLIYRRQVSGRKGYEYLPTEACEQLLPILLSLGGWGMEWARTNMVQGDYDVDLLMLYLERSVDAGRLPGREGVIKFHFTDLPDMPDWWLVVGPGSTDVCSSDPGRDVDVFIHTSVAGMTEVWIGALPLREARASDALMLHGPPVLTRNIFNWLNASPFADVPSALEILGAAAKSRAGN